MTELIKIMMVEDDPEVCGEYRLALKRRANMGLVYNTGSEQQALDYLEEHQIDVIILDIELEEGDGLSLLDGIRERKIERPFTVVVTNNGSSATLSYMREHGADYVYHKMNVSYSPLRVLSIIEKVYPYYEYSDELSVHPLVQRFNQHKQELLTRRYVENELEAIGFKRKRVGFDYMVEGIMMIMKNKKPEPLHVTNDIYPAIAAANNTSKESVERGIRGAIEATWTDADIRVLEYHYPFPYNEEQGRPTNSSFLTNMAKRLKMIS